MCNTSVSIVQGFGEIMGEKMTASTLVSNLPQSVHITSMQQADKITENKKTKAQITTMVGNHVLPDEIRGQWI